MKPEKHKGPQVTYVESPNGGLGVYIPRLAQDDPDRFEKVEWIKEFCRSEKGPFRFNERGVLYDEEAMAMAFEINPHLNEIAEAYKASFPHKSWD
jgi:hypothetical protein